MAAWLRGFFFWPGGCKPEHGELATLTKLFRAMPPFIVVFISLVAIGSFVPWPQAVADGAAVASRICLLTAVAALGLLTRTGSLLRLGWRPVALMVALTLVIAVVAALGVSA